jgi:hypothetical protein
MKSIALSVAIAVLAGATAWAQTPPDSTPPQNSYSASPSTSPSSSMRNPSTTGTANYSNGSGDDKWQMKSCLAKQKADNPNISKEDMKRNCAKLKPSSGQ